MESDGRVEVCVILTQPVYDILDTAINVEVFVNDNSIYIPSNVDIASKWNNNCFMFIVMLPASIF